MSVTFFMSLASFASAQLLNENSVGLNGQTRGNNYDQMLSDLSGNSKVVTAFNDKLWVPWYKTSSSCSVSDLQSGSNCNSGQAIDATHNCMVTDEFSQVGVLLAMGKDQTKMTQFYNTVKSINSTFGSLPSWRVYNNGGNIETCRSGINSNCDTASDGSARIIISLYTASKNPLMTDTAAKAKYAALATQMSNDFLKYEVDQTCRPSSLGHLGYDKICYWMAGGSQVKKGGIASSDYAYTGYFADGIIAMLAAYSATGNATYLEAAKGIELNYLQAANFDGNTFTAPPGKSFKWSVDASGIPRAQCTNTCSPVIWDMMDASRALGMCQANYYAHSMNVTLPGLDQYCKLWGTKYMNNANSAPIQFTPSGGAGSYQSGFYAQGLEALYQSGGHNPALFQPTLDNALKHYNFASKSFDNAPCFGVYTQAFSVRALGMGIGRDAPAFVKPGTVYAPTTPTPTTNTSTTTPTPTNTSTTPTTPTTPTTNTSTTNTSTTTTVIKTGIATLSATCVINGASCTKKSDVTSGGCRTILYGSSSGDMKVLGCQKTGGYVEMYLQTKPSAASYKACLANGCVSNNNGFARFIPTTTTTSTNTGTTTPTQNNTTPTTNTTVKVNNTSTNTTTTPVNTTTNTSTPVSTNATVNTTTNTPVNTSTSVPNSTSNTQVPTSSVPSVMNLALIVLPSGTLISNVAEGSSCRIVKYNTPKGQIDAKICDKGTDSSGTHKYEMYQLTQPNGAQICYKTACVGVTSGFASFSG